MTENKYYVPAIEEFHIGFEYEMHFEDTGWEGSIYSVTHVNLNSMSNWIKQNRIRVKCLDRKDIESFGYNLQVSSWDRKTLKRLAIQYIPLPAFDGPGEHFEKVIKETLVYQIMWNGSTRVMIKKAEKSETKGWGYMDFSNKGTPKMKKFITTPIMEFDVLYDGICKNKSQLKQILQWTEIIK